MNVDDARPRLKAPAAALLLIGLFAIGVLGGWLLFGGDDDSASEEASAGDLFAQTAQGGTFAKRGERFVLTLRDASQTTTLFSDRPERRSDSIATGDFVAAYGDLFADEPPNATLSSLERGQGEFTLELLRPRYDGTTDTLTYTVSRIGAEGAPLPGRFGSASLFIDAGASTVASGGYACTQGGTDGVWVCTFNGSDYQVAVSDLQDRLSGVDGDSLYCLQAWGGNGGNGATASGGHTGRGGEGGYARTIAHFGPTTAVRYLIGADGSHASGAVNSGAGGSSTIAGTDRIEPVDGGAETNQEFANGALVIAGGAGGGSYSDISQKGRDGGDGGTAVASASDGVAGAGEDGHGRSAGEGGHQGDGGSGHGAGTGGFGGMGGASAGAGKSAWQALPSAARFSGGEGAGPDSDALYQGGAGGGGWGGGGAGASRGGAGGAGGGGGGSLARVASVDDSSAPSECTDPPSLHAAFRMVIFNP